jgi:aminoglycoside phosphotransferase (APT) family kinase protein
MTQASPVEPPVDPRLVARLATVARRIGGAGAGPPRVLSNRTGELVVRFGPVVVKAHAPDTDSAALAARLATAGRPELAGVLLAPLGRDVLDGRQVTVWPAGTALRPDEVDDAPWEAAGALLAGLHRTPPLPGLPPAGGPAKVLRAMRRLAAGPAADGRRAAAVRAAYDTLPPWLLAGGYAGEAERRLCHGDWHLGQFVRVGAGWRMIDIDDLGGGDPAWDLARPAAWFAAGALPASAWERLLTAYRVDGGPAVPPTGDPWTALDLPARALAVQTAALAIATGDLDVAEVFVACCRRITRVEPTTGMRGLSKLLRI